MGYYNDKRNEFYYYFGFYPSRESGLLDLYIRTGYKNCFELLAKEFETNDKFKNSRDLLKKKFKKKFKFEADLFQLYEYKINKSYLPDVYMKQKGEFEKRFGFTPNNDILLKFCLNSNEFDHYLEKIIMSLSTGEYHDGLENELYILKENILFAVKSTYSELIEKRIDKIVLPRYNGDILIDTINSGFAEESNIDDKVSFYIPNNYKVFGENLFVVDYYKHYGHQYYTVELESYDLFGSSLYTSFKSSTVIDKFKEQFYDSYHFHGSESFVELFSSNREEFETYLRSIKESANTGNYKDNYESILFCIKENVLQSIQSDYLSFFDMNIKKLVLPTQSRGHVIDTISSSFVNENGEIYPNLSVLVVPDSYNKFEINAFANLKIQIEISNIDNKIEQYPLAFVNTKMFDDFKSNFFKLKTEAEWKYFIAPDAIKEQLINDISANRVVTIDYHEMRNDGISKIWWTDEDEWYDWNKEKQMWIRHYEYDSGSD